MSVLVVIFSETRASELTFSSFKKNLLDVYKADLALCVGNNCREDIHNPFYKHAKYQWIMEEPADFGDYLSNYIKQNFDAVKNYGKFVDFLEEENKKHHEKL